MAGRPPPGRSCGSTLTPTHATIRRGRNSADTTLTIFRTPDPRHVSAIEISPMAIVETESGYISHAMVFGRIPEISRKMTTIPRNERGKAAADGMRGREPRSPLYAVHFRLRAPAPIAAPTTRGMSQRSASRYADEKTRIVPDGLAPET